ncbi:MAG: hypothetical protein HYX73_01695 [Acidobacteria bacterium]|nr:hypothetical protein [Acidobacteriota bacterium]
MLHAGERTRLSDLPLIPQLPARAIGPLALQAYNSAMGKFNKSFFEGMDYAVIGYWPATSV